MQGIASEPTVAVVLPCHNAEGTIARAIASVLDQRQATAEIIVVDDGSTDGTLAEVRQFGSAVRIFSGARAGACAARNRGLREAKAEYVLFLDGDDELAGDHLGNGVRIAERQGADLVISPMILRTDARVLEARDRLPDHLECEALFETWLLGAQVNPSAMLWRRSFVSGIGGWDERVLVQQDGELAMRAFLKGAVVRHNPRGYGIYYVHNPTSLAATKTPEKEDNYVQTLARLLKSAKGTPFETRTEGIETALYLTARRAFLRGWPEIGRHALAVLQTIGPVQHRGTWRHRLLCAVLGLERKSRLWRA